MAIKKHNSVSNRSERNWIGLERSHASLLAQEIARGLFLPFLLFILVSFMVILIIQNILPGMFCEVFWIIIYISTGWFLRSKIALLDSEDFKSELRSINQQNCFMVLTRIVFLVSHSTGVWHKSNEYLAFLIESSLYCFASCFIIDYYFFVHLN